MSDLNEEVRSLRVLVICQMFPVSKSKAVISGMVKNPFNQTLAVAPHLQSVTVLTTGSKKFKSRVMGIRVISVGKSRLKGVFASFIYESRMTILALSLQRKIGFDLVHIHHLNLPILAALRRLGLFRPKVIYTAHGTSSPELSAARQGTLMNHSLLKINGTVQHWIDSFCWKSADQMISPSAFQVEEMIKLYGVKKSAIEVVYNGYDHGLYHPVSEEERRLNRSELGFSDNDFVVLFVGRAASKKGIEQLIRTCDRLLPKLPALKLCLVVGYIGRQKVYRDRIVRMSEERSYVRYSESVLEVELPNFYSSADLCVFPSVGYESIPTVIFEAMGSSLPVIVQGRWGIPEVLDGEFIGEESILTSSFGKEILRLAKSPDIRQTLGKNNLAKSASFTWESGGNTLLRLYRRVSGH